MSCAVDGCPKPRNGGRLLCSMHNMRKWRAARQGTRFDIDVVIEPDLIPGTIEAKYPPFEAEEPTQPDGPRVLTIDIETAPLESYTWGIWDQNVGLEQIKTEWSVLSYCAKWLGDPDIIFEHTGGRGSERVRDDSVLMDGLWSLLDAADIVVAQNGASFDVKKINSRLIMHGYGPYSPIRIVDTLRVARRKFGFTSTKLAWMSKYLTPDKKDEHKKFPGFSLWPGCLEDDPEAWEEMFHYNRMDVIATEQLYIRLLPWIPGHPNVAVYEQAEVRMCPKCGSEDLEANGYSSLQAGRYQRFKCLSCGGWCRGKRLLLTKDKRVSILAGE